MPPFDLAAYHELRTSTYVGAIVNYREHTESTMDDARGGADLLGPNACGTAYVAGEQKRGRGRQGRSWVSAASSGLYVTYHLCPEERELAPLLSVAGALAVNDALRASCGLFTQLKWPNDVLYEGRKMAGVLAEARHAERLDVFLGVGINVREMPNMPLEIASVATSIEHAGVLPPTLEALLAALSFALEQRVEQVEHDAGTMIDEWRLRLDTLGRRIQLDTPSGPVEGDAIDVNERGELVLRLDDGRESAYSAGDVTTL